MTGFLATMLFMSAVASPIGGLAPYDGDFKCGARPGADPDMLDGVVILDLELLAGNREDIEKQLASVRNRLGLFEIVCWRWLEANYGVEVRSGGVFLLTEEWLKQTRQDRVAALEALVSAQDRHREMTGEYAARIEDLPDFGVLSDYGLPGHLQLDMGRTSGGWQARLEPKEDWFRLASGRHLRGPGAAYHCFAFTGEVPAEWEPVRRDGQPEFREREPECFKGTQVW